MAAAGIPVSVEGADALMVSYRIGAFALAVERVEALARATDCSAGIPEGGALDSARLTVPLPVSVTELDAPVTPPPATTEPLDASAVAGPGVPGPVYGVAVAATGGDPSCVVPPHAAIVTATSASSAPSRRWTIVYPLMRCDYTECMRASEGNKSTLSSSPPG
jgi:hypothetical protein